MKVRSTLIATAAVLFAIALPAGSALAAPTVIGTVQNLQQLDVDGADLYWRDANTVMRMSIAGGASTAIFRAPRGTEIDNLQANSGTVSILTSKRARRQPLSTSRAYVYSAATGALRVAATATARIQKHSEVCGSDLLLGTVTEGGEALLVRDTFSLSRKLCHKPLALSSTVTAAGPSGSRPVFSGILARGSTLARLGGFIADADLVGNKLMLVGGGVGVIDLDTQQFVLVADGSLRSTIYGQLDPYGNALVQSFSDSSNRASFALISAESGYTAATRLDGDSDRIGFIACGKYLSQLNFDLVKGQSSSVTIFPNPLQPDGLQASTPLPLGKQSLWYGACDETTQIFALQPKPGTQEVLYAAPLDG